MDLVFDVVLKTMGVCIGIILGVAFLAISFLVVLLILEFLVGFLDSMIKNIKGDE